MNTSLDQIHEKDRGVLSPCGIACLGCDMHRDESLEAARAVVNIWEGFNLPDVAVVVGLTSEQVSGAIETIKKYIKVREERGPCPGCFKGGGPTEICGIANCVKARGYWTCAECEDFDPASERPCPHPDTDAASIPLGSRGETWALISRRYNGNNLENLKRCREIGYPALVEEVTKKVEGGWRTWQVISRERLFTRRE